MKTTEPIDILFGAAHARHAASFLPESHRTAQLHTHPVSSDIHRRAVATALDYVAGVQDGRRTPLVVYGPTNAWKTRLVSGIWQELASRVSSRSSYEEVCAAGTADNLLFISAARIPEMLKGEDSKWFTHASTAYLGVIDDLDKYPTGQWANTLLDLLDKRLVHNRLPTLVTMQITPRKFCAKYGEVGEAIISRFERMGGVFIRLDRLAGNASVVTEQEGPVRSGHEGAAETIRHDAEGT